MWVRSLLMGWVLGAIAWGVAAAAPLGEMRPWADEPPVAPQGFPVLDVSHLPAIEQSRRQMERSLPEDAREAFVTAIDQLIADAERLAHDVVTEDDYARMILRVLAPFEGLTAAEIVRKLERPTLAETREERNALFRIPDRLRSTLQGFQQYRPGHEYAMSMSRSPGRMVPDFSWIPPEAPLSFFSPDWFVSPLHPAADTLRDRLDACTAFDAEVYEAVFAESFYLLNQAVQNEDEGRWFLNTYRIQLALHGEPPPAPHDPRYPHGAATIPPVFRHHGETLLERPHALGEPILVAMYPYGASSPETRWVPYGEFPNTREFLIGLERLRELDIEGQDPLQLLRTAIRRYAGENQHRLPPASRVPGRLFFRAEQVFPAHHPQPEIVVSAIHPDRKLLIERLRAAPLTNEGAMDPVTVERIGEKSYYYIPQFGMIGPDAVRRAEMLLQGHVDYGASELQRQETGSPGSAREMVQTHTAEQPAAYGEALPDRSGVAGARAIPLRRTGRTLHSSGQIPAHLPLYTRPDRVAQALHATANALERHLYPPHRWQLPVLLERPHAVGAATRVLYADGAIELVPHGSYPNTAPFLAVLDALSAEQINDLEMFQAIGAAIYRYTRKHETVMAFPPHSATHGRLFLEAGSLYPDLLTDPEALFNPAHPDGRAARAELAAVRGNADGMLDPDHIEALAARSYFYLAGFGTNEEEGLAAAETYRAAADDWNDAPNPFRSPPVRQAFAFPETTRLPFELDTDDDRVYLTPFAEVGLAPQPGAMPILMQRPARPGALVLVLYADNQVRAVAPGRFPNTEAFLRVLESLETGA